MLFIKAALEAWLRSRCADVEKEGKEDALRIQRFIWSTLISYCPLAVLVEVSGSWLGSGSCHSTVVVRSTVFGPGHLGSNSKSTLQSQSYCLGLLV